MVGAKCEVKRRRRGRMVDCVKKLKARIASEMSITTIEDFEDFEREMLGCIGQ